MHDAPLSAVARTLALGLVAGLAIVSPACGGARKNECRMLEEFLDGEVPWQGAPRQAEMNQAGQAANWRWRAERAGERATAAAALALTEPDLVSLRAEITAHYGALVQSANATAAALERGDNAGLNAGAAAFDQRNNGRDALLQRLDTTCH
ncbi:MAG: hypothetical protein HYY06_10570 [Deltaproteobacteria bacterium]|nr:hypothetical protein [Deltaproteobacteria bacterium]